MTPSSLTQDPAHFATGIDRHRFPLRSWFQPYLAWVCIIFFSLVLIFNGFTAFIGGFAISDFFASYVTLPLIGICFIGFKLVKRTKGVRPEDIDLSRGPAEALWGTRYDQSPNNARGSEFAQDLPVVASSDAKV
jgi:amino acid transporter